MKTRHMTDEGDVIVSLLAEAWNKFLDLPRINPQDHIKFMHIIHKAQDLVIARVITLDPNEDYRVSSILV